MANAIFRAAIHEERCWDLWEALTEGGSATIDLCSGKLLLITGDQLNQLFGD